MANLIRIFQALTSAALFAFALFVAGPHHPAVAGEQPNVLVMGEDADKDSVPRHSRIFNRVLAAMTSDLGEAGFKVYDETAAGMEITNPGRVRRTNAELISVAQRIQQPPIDVIAVFQVYALVQQNAYSDIKDLRVRIAGRMIQVQTGKDLGNFEVAVGPRGLKPLPVKCNRDCILEHVGDEAKPIAHEVGIVLAQKLAEFSPVKSTDLVSPPSPPPAPAPAPPPAAGPIANANAAPCSGMSTAYTIALRGYDPQELRWIEQALMSFQGFEHHRPVRTETRYIEYWYETCSDHARLERNLRTMIEQLQGQNRLALNGNRFEVQKIPGLGKR